MSPELYFAVMLITDPQKARRILIAEDWENWFMDLFDEEYEDIFNGTFLANQSEYIERIIDKYIEATGISVTAVDEYARRVIEKATTTASQIQETTVRNVLLPYSKETNDIDEVATLISAGIAFSSAAYPTEKIKKWFSSERANLIALNEANWIMNNQEFFGEIENGKTKKTWHTALDEKVRMTHIGLEGVTIPINEQFHVGGYLMDYPLDTQYGAGAEEIVNCRCTVEYS